MVTLAKIPNSRAQNLSELHLFQVFGWTRNNTGKLTESRKKMEGESLVKKTEDKSRLLQPWEIGYYFAFSSSLRGKKKIFQPMPSIGLKISHSSWRLLLKISNWEPDGVFLSSMTVRESSSELQHVYIGKLKRESSVESMIGSKVQPESPQSACGNVNQWVSKWQDPLFELSKGGSKMKLERNSRFGFSTAFTVRLYFWETEDLCNQIKLKKKHDN